jgi:hypothetical protein
MGASIWGIRMTLICRAPCRRKEDALYQPELGLLSFSYTQVDARGHPLFHARLSKTHHRQRNVRGDSPSKVVILPMREHTTNIAISLVYTATHGGMIASSSGDFPLADERDPGYLADTRIGTSWYQHT